VKHQGETVTFLNIQHCYYLYSVFCPRLIRISTVLPFARGDMGERGGVENQGVFKSQAKTFRDLLRAYCRSVGPRRCSCE
jgi:hypothetical protein